MVKAGRDGEGRKEREAKGKGLSLLCRGMPYVLFQAGTAREEEEDYEKREKQPGNSLALQPHFSQKLSLESCLWEGEAKVCGAQEETAAEKGNPCSVGFYPSRQGRGAGRRGTALPGLLVSLYLSSFELKMEAAPCGHPTHSQLRLARAGPPGDAPRVGVWAGLVLYSDLVVRGLHERIFKGCLVSCLGRTAGQGGRAPLCQLQGSVQTSRVPGKTHLP